MGNGRGPPLKEADRQVVSTGYVPEFGQWPPGGVGVSGECVADTEAQSDSGDLCFRSTDEEVSECVVPSVVLPR